MIITQWRKNAFVVRKNPKQTVGAGYLELARTWLEAASKMDYGPGILALPSCRWR